MARKSKQDIAKAKAAKQKKIAIAGTVVLIALLAIEVPKTMKMMGSHAAAPVVSSTASTTTPGTTTPTVTPSDPTSLAAPTLAGAAPTETTTTSDSSSGLVSAVPMQVDPGQLKSFEALASRDPFDAQVPSGGGSSGPSAGGSSGTGSGSSTGKGSGSGGGGGGSTPPGPSKPSKVPTPPAPAPTSAVISLNGELSSVQVGGAFPTGGSVFAKVGSVFELGSLTETSAKVSIVGGSYASGAASITLRVKVPVTLQNTADGSKYTLILEPQGTPVTAPGGSAGTTGTTGTTSTATTQTMTTPGGSIVPGGSGG